MKAKLTQIIGAFLITVLFGSQAAVANSQIKDDFAYAFGSAEGLDSGRISLLSPQEMDEIEGQFLGWIIRVAVPRIKKVIDILKLVRVEAKSGGKGHKVGVWLRIGKSHSNIGKFRTWGIRWGSTRYHRNKKIKDLTLRELNTRLRATKIPLNTWRTNDPGHLHIIKLRKKPDPKSPGSGPSSMAHRSANTDEVIKVTPDLHKGSGGVITAIDWETITAEDLLTGRYDEALLTAAADGPKGKGWGMEDLTEKQARLGLSILAFVIDPENNADIDIPLQENWNHLRMAGHLRKNPRKNDRVARLAKLGLKQLEYIIGQHRQDYHPTEESPGDTHTLSAARTDATYLPIQAHWWMHDFNYRR